MSQQANHNVYVVMGVSGCGKSTIGKRLAQRLNLPFYDADDFHPQANRDKMAAGQPLNDHDRQPWLETLAHNIQSWASAPEGGAVLACSALKRAYRDTLRSTPAVRFVLLVGSFELILSRMQQRSDHFMPATLLQSQFDTLETPGPPHDANDPAYHVAIGENPNHTVDRIIQAIDNEPHHD
ncbi:gluconokinase [Mucisphaera calidilacus]|uniref:Gluconokinase n=1 Tax=Mucisphaera calidilacus TaxID=2527982 RepID=A0A518C009_9BACT|nr:gluconokinase [Mucisphaera calidilacus]QDU72553.1 Thermoresistant gluconokinase [Mucisphaera calidilacus]